LLARLDELHLVLRDARSEDVRQAIRDSIAVCEERRRRLERVTTSRLGDASPQAG
jgi:hypothetical protein